MHDIRYSTYFGKINLVNECDVLAINLTKTLDKSVKSK
jgi:hypothetical protein